MTDLCPTLFVLVLAALAFWLAGGLTPGKNDPASKYEFPPKVKR